MSAALNWPWVPRGRVVQLGGGWQVIALENQDRGWEVAACKADGTRVPPGPHIHASERETDEAIARLVRNIDGPLYPQSGEHFTEQLGGVR